MHAAKVHAPRSWEVAFEAWTFAAQARNRGAMDVLLRRVDPLQTQPRKEHPSWQQWRSELLADPAADCGQLYPYDTAGRLGPNKARI